MTKLGIPRHDRSAGSHRTRRKVFNELVEDNFIRRVSYREYLKKVRSVYDGPKGAILATCSMISLHTPLMSRLMRQGRFDLTTVRRILDVGSGAGQIAQQLLKYAHPDAEITCFDLSCAMMRRAHQRLKSDRPHYVVADVTRLPFPDNYFDCVTCGYVLEHLPDARLGLAELARVMMPGAKMLLLATEDNFSGAWTSRLWCCRTYNRQELRRSCEELGLQWQKELWYTEMHKVLRAGGICAELVKK